MLVARMFKQTMTQIKKFYSFILLAVLVCSCRYSRETDYVFPYNYDGWVAIVYGCDRGQAENVVDGRNTIVVDSTGIYLAAYDRSKGILSDRHYKYNANHQLEEILEISKTVQPEDSTLYVRGKILVSHYLEKDVEKSLQVVYINISNQYSSSIENNEFDLFQEKVVSFLRANNVKRK
jgi:hypothetical protein